MAGPLDGAAAAAGAAGLQPGSLQSGEDWPDGPGRANRPQPPGDELRAILAAVDPDRIEAIVRKLVSFGTRHTLSDQDNPERGIGAARDWIFSEMTSSAARSGGRMTVEKQSFIQPPGDEVVWRPTTEDDWTHVIDVGWENHARINLSKDNVFFGVRAVDRTGMRSTVAFPTPSP
jgi:hypothetical protein